MNTLAAIKKNINTLQHELLKEEYKFQNEIHSIIIDGSVIRGDFIPHASDIDLTITTYKTVSLETQKTVLGKIKNAQSKLPERKFPQKPLVYDIQWQDFNTVIEAGKRVIDEWSEINIPTGYPKLWLYAFDSIKYHKVIFGEDVTKHYSKISPKYFIPIRKERILKSAHMYKGNITEYEKQNGAITQVKNAWEAIRCLCLAYGLKSIKKNDVYEFAKIKLNGVKELQMLEDIKDFYFSNKNIETVNNEFRNELYRFTINILEKYL